MKSHFHIMGTKARFKKEFNITKEKWPILFRLSLPVLVIYIKAIKSRMSLAEKNSSNNRHQRGKSFTMVRIRKKDYKFQHNQKKIMLNTH